MCKWCLDYGTWLRVSLLFSFNALTIDIGDYMYVTGIGNIMTSSIDSNIIFHSGRSLLPDFVDFYLCSSGRRRNHRSMIEEIHQQPSVGSAVWHLFSVDKVASRYFLAGLGLYLSSHVSGYQTPKLMAKMWEASSGIQCKLNYPDFFVQRHPCCDAGY